MPKFETKEWIEVLKRLDDAKHGDAFRVVKRHGSFLIHMFQKEHEELVVDLVSPERLSSKRVPVEKIKQENVKEGQKKKVNTVVIDDDPNDEEDPEEYDVDLSLTQDVNRIFKDMNEVKDEHSEDSSITA